MQAVLEAVGMVPIFLDDVVPSTVAQTNAALVKLHGCPNVQCWHIVCEGAQEEHYHKDNYEACERRKAAVHRLFGAERLSVLPLPFACRLMTFIASSLMVLAFMVCSTYMHVYIFYIDQPCMHIHMRPELEAIKVMLQQSVHC